MPGQQRLRRCLRGNLCQKLMTNPFRLGRQTSTLVVVEPNPLATQLFFEDALHEDIQGRTAAVDSSSQPRRSAGTGMARELSASSMLMIASAGDEKDYRKFRQIQYRDHTVGLAGQMRRTGALRWRGRRSSGHPPACVCEGIGWIR
jgi:hypothetical protein